MRRVQIIGALCLAVATCLVSAVGASAAPTDPFQYNDSFALPGVENPDSLVVNFATGNLLTFENGVIKQFDSNGNPVDFSALGSSEISVGAGGILVIDNSGTASQGTMYVAGGDQFFYWEFKPDGTPVPGSPFAPYFEGFTYNNTICGGGISPAGNFLLGNIQFPSGEEFTPSGVPTGRSISPPGLTFPCAMPFDSHGNVYVPTFFFDEKAHPFFSVHKFDPDGTTPDLGEVGPIYPYNEFGSLVVDPATDDLYVKLNSKEANGSRVVGTHYSNPPSKENFEVLGGLGEGRSMAIDATGQWLYLVEGGKINVFHREPPSVPYGQSPPDVDRVRSTGAVAHASMIAGGEKVTYRFEYGTDTSYGKSTPPAQAQFSQFAIGVASVIGGLQPDTTYHIRLVTTNAVGTTYGPDSTFTTFRAPIGGTDPCPNALARKQTTAQRLPDCRAYELASASDTGGYDVESHLAPGQTPFPGFPLAHDRLLYATHSGAVPGPWNATNKGPDPYVATRTANGWVTQYEGLPSNLNPAAGSFSSVLGEADSSLSTLAFAGAGLCSPCFTNGGLATGIPVRMPNGQLVQGMSGSLAGSVDPSAKPEGKVAKYFSGNGSKLLFASKYAFEPGANGGGDLTVYERDLAAGQTEIVSTDPAGNALTGTVSELDVSTDGSRVVIGKGVSTDPGGNAYVHLYLHLAGRPGSIDLAPGATTGVLYAGMTSDGSKVFFTSPDKLTGADTDASADLYEADVDGSGNLGLELVSANSSDACSPVANSNGEHWNTTGANVDCSAVAISGGGGVASSTGAVYFLSPESLGGQGTLNEPNLYLAQPSGAISLVATLEPNNPLVLDSVKANAARRTGDFQTTPSGNYAAFTSDLTLGTHSTHGLRSVYRYAAGSGQLDCASCDTTSTGEASIFAVGELPPNGLALLEDGRLFFTTAAQLLLNDANGKRDVYEWSGGTAELISAGSGAFDSALLTVSADGTDAFFFTHDDLAPEEDRNGSVMRIYDAREGGGFFKLPASVPCQASDECHGAGTPAPGPADIKSSGKTTPGNVLVCPKKRIKKRGHCVKKAHAKKKHHKKKRGAAKKRAASTDGKRGGRNA